MCSNPTEVTRRLDRAPSVRGQAEELEPVAAVRRERVGHGTLEREPVERAVGGPTQVALDDATPLTEERCEHPTGRLRDGEPDRGRDGVGHGGAEAVRHVRG